MQLELDLLLDAANAAPDRVAVRVGAHALTYAELRSAAAATASVLRQHGAQPGEAIALLMDNSLEFVVGYVGIQWLGAIAMPLNSKDSAERIRYCLALAGSRLVLTRSSADADRLVLDDLPGAASIPLQGILLGRETHDVSVPRATPALDDTALIMFTTGTTGAPKGVLLSHANVLAAMRGIQAFMRLPPRPIEVVPTPMYHNFGLSRMRTVLALQGTLVLERGFVFPSRIFDAIEKHRATGFASVAAGWEILLAAGHERFREAFRSVRYVEIGSAPLPLERKRELMSLLPGSQICMHYGLTEASRSTFMEFHADADDLATIGRPLLDVQVTVRDDVGSELPDGEEGELCVKGPTVFAGYLKDEAATGAAFFGPWLRTGDLGRREPSGRLYLSGRLKELINLGGSKVSPLEIEQVLDTCPGVIESAVIGVSGSGVTGETVHAFVVPSTADLTPDAVRAFAAARLDPLRRPSHVHLVDALPRTGSGKLQRLKLRDRLPQGM